MKPPLIIIAGATASGKTKISIDLAKKINGEIISADSMQVYKYMNIGTAKPNLIEQDGIKHYLINELFPDEEFSIAVFQKLANKYIEEIYSKNKIPILVGGTGFYINSIIFDNNFTETFKDEDYRNYLYDFAKKNSNQSLHDLLKEIDFESSEKIHFNNIRRIVRGLEYFKQTGEKISIHNEREKQKETKYNLGFFILDWNREILYQRINKRVDKMIEDGLVFEVENLLRKGYSENLISMNGLGYKEIISYLNNETTLEEAIEILKRDTRKFAKRQITWFKNQTNGEWINFNDETLEHIIKFCKDKKIIN